MKGLDVYLAKKESKGPLDEPIHGEYESFFDGALDVKMTMALILNSALPHSQLIRASVCIPKWVLCIETLSPSKINIHFVDKKTECPTSFKSVTHSSIRAGIIVTNMKTNQPQMHIPQGVNFLIEKCVHKGKQFVLINLGLYNKEWTAEDGHSNSILIDVKRKCLERFEPHGSYRGKRKDDQLRDLFRIYMPGFSYDGTIQNAPQKGPQQIADAFDGLCATYSAMYIIQRVINPSIDSSSIQHEMVKGTQNQVRKRALRFHKYMANILRMYAHGALDV
jgi:hypothetical protein